MLEALRDTGFSIVRGKEREREREEPLKEDGVYKITCFDYAPLH